MALMTAAEVRAVYLRTLTGTAEDANLDTLIARFDALGAGYCGFPAMDLSPTFEARTYTHYLDGPGGQILRLRVRPVISVTSIHDDPTHEYSSTYLVAATDYTLYGDLGLVELKPTSVWGEWSGPEDEDGLPEERNVKVVYSAGFATIPAGIKHACGLQIKHWWDRRDSIGLKSISQGGSTTSLLPLTLLPETREALRDYRLAAGWAG